MVIDNGAEFRTRQVHSVLRIQCEVRSSLIVECQQVYYILDVQLYKTCLELFAHDLKIRRRNGKAQLL